MTKTETAKITTANRAADEPHGEPVNNANDKQKERAELIIAIDGPSGAGKSTLGRMLAKRLGLLYIDTGAMYRAAALKVLENRINPDDAEAVAEACRAARIELRGEADALQVLLDGRDVTDAIRDEHVSHTASVISTNSAVRREMVARQREIAAAHGAVLDGRDIGTVVFPNADAKFYLTATPHTRADRRYEQDAQRARTVNYAEILRDIQTRDERDQRRADSPLTIADDAVVIDSSEMSVEEVLDKMLSEIGKKKRHES